MKTSPAKKKANRKNATKSTGPKTKAGKMAVALNGTVHGLRSANPVIPWLESEEHWLSHREGIVSQLNPIGAVEAALADRIALGFWRLGRCVETEPRVLHAIREKHRWQAIRNVLVSEHLMRVGESAEDVLKRLIAARDLQRSIEDLWTKMISRSSKATPDESVANELLDLVCGGDEWAVLEDPFNAAFDWPPRRMSDLRAMFDWLFSHLYEEPEISLFEFARRINENVSAAESQVSRIEEAGRNAAELAFVDADSVEKLMRYETTIHRTLLKDIHELQRIQALRNGDPVMAPVSIDISVEN